MTRVAAKILVIIILGVTAQDAWGLSPEDRCEADKNKSAGKYAYCRQNAQAKAIKRGAAPDYSNCDEVLLDTWARIEQKAITLGGTCVDSLADTAIQSFVTWHADDVAAALEGGPLPDCPADLAICNADFSTCDADLGSCNGDLTTCDSNLAQTQSDLTTCDGDLTSCSGDLSTCGDDLATCESDLTQRQSELTTCDGNLTSCSGNLSTCAGDLTTCDSNLTQTQSELTTCDGNLTSCSGDLTTCGDDLTTCQSDLTETQSDLTTCQGNVATCENDLAAAELCGNGVIDAGEDCDQGDLDEETCVAQAFAGGNLTCSAGCSFDTSGCYAARFVDHADGTITDNKTRLTWEKKVERGGVANFSNPHDADNTYFWSGACSIATTKRCQPTAAAAALCAANYEGGASSTGCDECTGGEGTCSEIRTAWTLAADLNTAVFAGETDWRVPTREELGSIVDYFDPDITAPLTYVALQGASCGGACTDITSAECSCTQSGGYWSASYVAPFPQSAFGVSFSTGAVYHGSKSSFGYVRAVRGGS